MIENKCRALYSLLVLTSSIGADYPLTKSIMVSGMAEGGARPGPVIWIVDFPLFILFVHFLAKRVLLKEDSRPIFSNLGKLFVAFIVCEAFTIFVAPYKSYVFYQVVQSIRALIFFLLISNYITDKDKLSVVIKIFGSSPD